MNIIGLDISKDHVDCYLRKKDGREDYCRIGNDMAGFLLLHEKIKQHRIRKLLVCMEATGIYYEQSAKYFSRYYNVCVVNPLKIKEHAKKTFARTKTDKTDAKLIADYARRYHDTLHDYQPPKSEQYELGKLNALLNQLKKQIQQHRNQLHSAKDDYVANVHSMLIRELERHMRLTVERIEHVICCSDWHCQYRNLMTIPGIGKETAAVLIQHLSSRNFATANQFVAFAGLNPQIVRSGTSVCKPDKLSRLGHRHLKRALFMPALAAARNECFKGFIKRLLDKGKKKMVALVALMRKLAKIAYGIYKNGKPFDCKLYQAPV
ncbi:IS110 family transposase [Conchiformibius steedae DSM 2580]|uniref:IS110 family transposase n=1 Tax=Conchiformibius steedae DSM 2580 TaxID=1121352 RepID=A0AAE9HXT7_9NEIS|nr:IS110 family transposase [Conchiformibius steedae]QMT33768.1 IS110 family transposase [Conchiformibius steedae]URD68430.1 IS110 family transposase [Conchiformibius steedae DSM 2580]